MDLENQEGEAFQSASNYYVQNPTESAAKSKINSIEVQEYSQNIARLKGMEEILENQVKDKQDKIKQLYLKLHNKKKELLEVATQEYNKKTMKVDIGLYQEFSELRANIQTQEKTIQRLMNQIDKQGLTGVSNNTGIMQVKKKMEDLEEDLMKGRKFASTQYVRDYLEKTHIYKVSYEDVKYEYEVKIRLKDYLEKQKKSYKEKEEELAQATQEQHRFNAQLQMELANLQKKYAVLQNS